MTKEHICGTLRQPSDAQLFVSNASAPVNLDSGQPAVFTLGVDLAMGTIPRLTAAIDRNGKFSGYYRCSLCVAEFRPNPKCLKEIATFFAAHVRLSHPAQETTRQDVVEPTGRIATENTQN